MSDGFGLCLLASILAVSLDSPPADRPRPSERYSFSTYRERAGALTALVDGYPASLRAGDPYIPLPVAVGWSGPERLELTPESFRLVDGEGRAYPAASYREVLERYAKLTFDRSILRGRPMVIGQQFANYSPVPARFFPPVDFPTRTARVELARFTWFQDVLYFPNPGAGLDGVLSLLVSPRGAAEPVEVKFRVQGVRTARHR